MEKYRSKICYRTLNPVWNEEVTFAMPESHQRVFIVSSGCYKSLILWNHVWSNITTKAVLLGSHVFTELSCWCAIFIDFLTQSRKHYDSMPGSGKVVVDNNKNCNARHNPGLLSYVC